MKAKSLKTLCKETNSKRFRVRHITTLQDYLILYCLQKNKDGTPEWFYGQNLDKGEGVQLNAHYSYFALLSSKEEIDKLNSFREMEAIKWVYRGKKPG